MSKQQKEERKISELIQRLTDRLVTCPMEEFHKVQAELFAVQKQQKAIKQA